jgi:flagellin-like protein
MKKRALSPVIATVLLVAIVVVLALIIFIWASSFIKENVEKFGSSIDLSCDNIDFIADIADKKLGVENRGNVPIYNIKVALKEPGTQKNVRLENPKYEIGVGETNTEINIVDDISESVEEIIVTPIILGSTGSGRQAHVCDKASISAIRL